MMNSKGRCRAELDNDTQSDVVSANLNFNSSSSSLKGSSPADWISIGFHRMKPVQGAWSGLTTCAALNFVFISSAGQKMADPGGASYQNSGYLSWIIIHFVQNVEFACDSATSEWKLRPRFTRIADLPIVYRWKATKWKFCTAVKKSFWLFSCCIGLFGSHI